VEEVPVFLVLSVFGGAAVGSEEEFELSVGIVTPAETADPSTALGMTIRYHLQLLHDHHIRVISSGAARPLADRMRSRETLWFACA
jgi:hypothetical protein